MDPLTAQFSSWSPYNYAANNPVLMIDPDGRAPCPTGDCDEANGMDGNTYSIPSGSGTYNDDGQLSSFEHDGFTYNFNGNGYSRYSLMLESDVPYDATANSSNGEFSFTKRTKNNSVRLIGDRPQLKYIGENGRVLSDNLGWGEFGSAENLAFNTGRNFQSLLNSIEKQHYGPFATGRYGHGDPADYALIGLKETAIALGTGGVGYGLKLAWAARTIGSIQWVGQGTRTLGHGTLSSLVAMRYVLDPRVSRVGLDIGFRRLGVNLPRGVRWGPRPDISILYRNGNVRAIEIWSATDNIMARTLTTRTFLNNAGVNFTLRGYSGAKIYNSAVRSIFK